MERNVWFPVMLCFNDAGKISRQVKSQPTVPKGILGRGGAESLEALCVSSPVCALCHMGTLS